MKTAILTLKNPGQKESLLRARFMEKKKRLCFYPGVSIQSKFWLQSSQQISSKHPGLEKKEIDSMNQYLKSRCAELNRILYDKAAAKLSLDLNEINRELDKAMNREAKPAAKPGEEAGPDDFISFMSSYIKSKKAKKREVQKLEQTRKLVILANELTTKKALQEWEQLTIKEKSRSELKAFYKLPFEKIDLAFIEKFRDYLYSAKYNVKIKGVDVEQGYKANTIDKQVKGLKQFILAAIERKLVAHFTWSSIKAENIEVDSVYTDFDEITAIYSTPLKGKTETLVRDKYVFNFFLGLRYSNLNKLENHLFRKGVINGKRFVVYCGRNQKTDKRIEFALHPTAVEILERYNFSMRKLNSSEFNETIKVVAKKAGLTQLERIREVRGGETIIRDVPKFELMSSHAGRRSFCTNIYTQGVAVGAIMSISGHSTEREFRKYIKQPSLKLDIVAEQVFAIPTIKAKLKVA